MRSFIIFALAFMALLAFAFGGDCEYEGHSFNAKETYAPIGNCIQYTCDGPDQYYAKICPVEFAPDTCKYVPEDTSKPYPKCCPKYEC